MTTVVYRDGVLAADTMITYGTTLMPGSTKKIHKLPNGALYGFTGSLEIGEVMRRHLVDVGQTSGVLEDRHDLKDENFEALVVQPDGTTLFFENRTWMILKLPYVAMGSGKDYAYGALELGASAKQAVKAAKALDANTGGRIVTLKAHAWKGSQSSVEQVWTEIE